MQWWWIIDAVLFIGLGVIGFFLLRMTSTFNRLTKGITNKNLSQLLRELIQSHELTQAEIDRVNQEIKSLKDKSLNYIQKIGLVRFNPFSDTGGDQSFSLAILDNKDNGVIITSFYARTGVRWYIKTIRNGKGVEHELSKEEEQAIRSAVNRQK